MIIYEAKIFTESDGKKSRCKKGTAKIYLRVVDNIYAAIKGCSIIDHFSFNIVTKVRKEKIDCLLTADYIKWGVRPKKHGLDK